MAAICDREFVHVIEQKLESARKLAHKCDEILKTGTIKGFQKVVKKVVAEKSFLEITCDKVSVHPLSYAMVVWNGTRTSCFACEHRALCLFI